MSHRLVIPTTNPARPSKVIHAHLILGDFCVHYVAGSGFRVTRHTDGGALADFQTLVGAAACCGAVFRLPRGTSVQAVKAMLSDIHAADAQAVQS